MLVRIILSIFFICAVKTEDTVLPHEQPQQHTETPSKLPLPTDQGVLNQNSSDGRKFNFYYDSNVLKPVLDENPAVRIHNPTVCKNSGILLKILDVLLKFVNHEIDGHIMLTESVADITELIKEYLKYAPNDPPHNELYDKLKRLVRDANGRVVPIPVDDHKYSLRDTDYGNQHDGNVKTKIVFQYKLPSSNQPNCEDIFLKFNQAARDAYRQLAKYPMCRSPNKNIHFPYVNYDIFEPNFNKENNYINPKFFPSNAAYKKYLNPSSIFVPSNEGGNDNINQNTVFVFSNEGNNGDVNPSPIDSPNNNGNSNYINANPIFAPKDENSSKYIRPNNEIQSKINLLDVGHPSYANEGYLHYLKKFSQQSKDNNNANLISAFPPNRINSNNNHPVITGHPDSINQDKKILEQRNHNLKDILSIIQTHKTSNLKNEPYNLNVFEPETPSSILYYPGFNAPGDLKLPTSQLNPMISSFTQISKPKLNKILTKVSEKYNFPYQMKDKSIYGQSGFPYNQNAPYFVQEPTQNHHTLNQKPYRQDAFSIQVEYPYETQGLLNSPHSMQVPTHSSNKSNQKTYHHDTFTIQKNQYNKQGSTYQTNMPYYFQIPIQKQPVQTLLFKQNIVNQNPNEIQKYITYSNSPFNYSPLFHGDYKTPNLSSLVTMPNLMKLDSSFSKDDVIELTYLLKSPNPLVYQPSYYVKYRLPYTTFLYNIKNLLTRKPHLQLYPEKLYQELIALSNVSKTSPDLKGFNKDYILKLTFNNGSLIAAKKINDKVTDFDEQLKVIKDINSDLTAEEIVNLGSLVTKDLQNNQNIINQSQLDIFRAKEGLNPSPVDENTIPFANYNPNPFSGFSVYNENPLVPNNLELHASNSLGLNSLTNLAKSTVSHPGVSPANFISNLAKSLNLGSSEMSQDRSNTISSS